MSAGTYGVSHEGASGVFPAPDLQYRPPVPRNLDPGIALVGCGSIARVHLAAYRHAGLNVRALCSRSSERADALRAEYYPAAEVYSDLARLLAREDIRVVDITTHPEVRPPLVEAALRAGKHVLSQKPFVLDLAEGERLCQLGEDLRLHVAVNQNGRWAPHFAYALEAVRTGLLGTLSSIDCSVHWDHHWIVGTPFEENPALILADFGIHWFDIVTAFMGNRQPLAVHARVARSQSQRARPPFLAHAVIEYDNAQATLVFNADCARGTEDRTTLVGSLGTLRSVGPSLTDQRVTLHTAAGTASPTLAGTWFREGFIGTMTDLLTAIEEQRPPLHTARENLRSLALCQAAVASSA